MVKDFTSFDGIKVENKNLARQAYDIAQQSEALDAAVVRDELTRDVALEFALVSMIAAVNALLAAATAKCYRKNPPADIDYTTNAKGDLILRCRHASPHEWKLDGTKL